jgi:type IV pili sensor histidine kinase/response regulator
MQVGRYSIIAPVASAAQSDPLQTMVRIRFPAPHISTVGDAMRYLLRHSGYQLAGPEAADPAMTGLLNHLLPKVHRTLGPMTLQTMLTTLAGNAYQIVVDPVNRLIAFALTPNYRSMKLRLDDLGPTHTTPEPSTTAEPGERHDPSA